MKHTANPFPKPGFWETLIVLTLSVLSPVFSIDRPSADGVIYRNFGWNDRGEAVLGISYESTGPVLAADRGEVIFRRKEDDSAGGLPAPLGNWIALDHGDGIISVYSRMDGSPAAEDLRLAEKSAPLGKSGTSGWTSREGFYFFLFDRRERRWINPLMIVPAQEDTRYPSILSVALTDSEGVVINPAQTRTLSQGRYTITVAANDTLLRPDEYPLAPHRIVCSVNGTEISALTFETYSARNGELMVYRNGLIPLREVFAPYPAWQTGEIRLTRGQATLEIIAQDIAGNSRRAVFRLQIE